MINNFPFDTIDLDAGEVETLETTYKQLRSKFSICLPADAEQHINRFELFNNTPGNSVGGTLLINYPHINCYLNFVKRKYHYSYGGRGGGGGQNFEYNKYQVWAFVNSKVDFGRVLIRHETLADKILELVHPIELKFQGDDIFSKHFYVVTNDSEKALTALTPGFRQLLADLMYHDFVIETVNQTLVIRTNQPITPEDTMNLTNLASKIAELV